MYHYYKFNCFNATVLSARYTVLSAAQQRDATPTCRGRRSPAARFDLSEHRPPCWQCGRGLSAPAVLKRHPARRDKTECGEVAPPERGKRWPNETGTRRIFHSHFRPASYHVMQFLDHCCILAELFSEAAGFFSGFQSLRGLNPN